MKQTNKKYKIIYADPPWSYADNNCNGAVGDHYKTMSIEDIKNLNVQDITAKDCVLFMWVTYPMLQEGLAVGKAWGFTYKSIAFQWLKLNRKNGKPFFGLGRWTRGNTECCLLFVKGKPQRKSNSVFQLIQSPIARHSEKPGEAREKIVQLMGGGGRIELFARKRFKGWDCWGNEVKSDIKLSPNVL